MVRVFISGIEAIEKWLRVGKGAVYLVADDDQVVAAAPARAIFLRVYPCRWCGSCRIGRIAEHDGHGLVGDRFFQEIYIDSDRSLIFVGMMTGLPWSKRSHVCGYEYVTGLDYDNLVADSRCSAAQDRVPGSTHVN